MTHPKARQGGPTASATLHDVARVAGVSPITVSRALNHPKQLAAATLQRVMQAVAETGYVPNLVAGGLRASRTGLVAVLVPTLKGLFVDVVQSITAAFESENFQVILGQTGYSTPGEDKLLRTIVGRKPDGIVIAGVNHSPEMRRILIASGIPIVETWDTTTDPIDMLVGISHEDISRRVCAYLAGRGRCRFALVSGNDERAQRRNEVFLKAARERGLQPPLVHLLPAPTNHAAGRAAMAAILEHHPRTDAIVCSSDMLAMGVLTEARLRGVSLPDSVAVIGAGDMDFAASLSPSLTSVRVDRALLGKISAQFILDSIAGREIPQRIVNLDFSLVLRESA